MICTTNYKSFGNSVIRININLTKRLIQFQEAILILSKRSSLDLALIADNSKLIVDARNTMKEIKTKAKAIKVNST